MEENGELPLPIVFYMYEEYQKTPNLNIYATAAIIAAYDICLASFSVDSLLTAHSSSEIMMK